MAHKKLLVGDYIVMRAWGKNDADCARVIVGESGNRVYVREIVGGHEKSWSTSPQNLLPVKVQTLKDQYKVATE